MASAAHSLASAANLLGVSASATQQEIASAFRSFAGRWHPDKHRNKAPEDQRRAALMFDDAQAAFNILKADSTPAATQVGIDPQVLSQTLQTLFAQSYKKAKGRHNRVAQPAARLARQIGGFTSRIQVAGDGNCLPYSAALAFKTGVERNRAWPEEYNVEPFLEPAVIDWWEQKGAEYRAGASDGPHIIAAAAVLRSQIPEDVATQHDVYKFGHTLEREHIDALGKALGCCFHVHAQFPRAAHYEIRLGATEHGCTTIGLTFKPRGGGHYDLLTGSYEELPMESQGQLEGSRGHPRQPLTRGVASLRRAPQTTSSTWTRFLKIAKATLGIRAQRTPHTARAQPIAKTC